MISNDFLAPGSLAAFLYILSDIGDNYIHQVHYISARRRCGFAIFFVSFRGLFFGQQETFILDVCIIIK